MDYSKAHKADHTQKISADETKEERERREALDETLQAPVVAGDTDPVTGEEVPITGRDLGGSDDPNAGVKELRGEADDDKPKRPAARKSDDKK